MPYYPPPSAASAATPIGNMGIMVTTPASVDAGYSWTYGTNAKPFPAYTSNPQSSAYVGNLLDLTQALRLTDGNALRLAYENLRVFAENLAAQHNAISIALKNAGLIST